MDEVAKKREEKRREAAYKAMDGLGLLREHEHSDAYAGVNYLVLDALGRAEDAKLA